MQNALSKIAAKQYLGRLMILRGEQNALSKIAAKESTMDFCMAKFGPS